MTRRLRLVRCTSGAAAAEMAFVIPLILVLTCGCLELGNYFLDEHRLVKAVRDGARYAARQDISNFTACSGNAGGTVVADTQKVVLTGLLSGGSSILPKTGSATIAVTVDHCTTSVNSTALNGIYSGIKNGSGTVVGAPVVKVSASIPYQSVMRSFGFNGFGLTLNAQQQAAVMGW
jgi:Flp pilus assembly protein TadG